VSESQPLTGIRGFWARHRRLFWMLHSTWALATGITVVVLAREHYRLVLWVVVFLVLTWASTLYFGGVSAALPPLPRVPGRKPKPRPPKLAHEVTSYITRVMYQETLFFLLPFYAYSTVVHSPNVLFMGLLGGLAVFSCIDLVFDHWLRTKPLFGLLFFAIIAFAALNLLLPLLFGLRLRFATPAAALLAIGAAAPLALRTSPRTGGRGFAPRFVLAALVLVAIAVRFPALVPPVPIRMQTATFAPSVERATLAIHDTLRSPVSSAAVGGSLAVVVQVFAPLALPALVQLEWTRDGTTIRESRDIEIVAQKSGFRVWDAWHPEGGVVPPGAYQVVLRTRGNRVFGVARLRVENP